MQRSAVNRIGDLLAVVTYSVFMLYNLRWGTAYTYEVFWLHQPTHRFDMVVFWAVTIFVGYWWGVNLWNLVKYHTLPWFFRNLGVYIPVLFWRGLTAILMWMVTQLTILASWVLSRSYPGRGMRITLDFEDERDFRTMLRTAKEDGLPVTASVDGVPLLPEEYDVPLYARPSRSSYDEDILDTALTYPSVSALHVVDSYPTDL